MSKLIIRRIEKNPVLGIIGHLYEEDDKGFIRYICDTCENLEIGFDPNKDLAIPDGEYRLGVHQSAKFSNSSSGSRMAVIFSNKVPRERCILIHAGNSHLDTLGCILLGNYDKNNEMFTDSRDTVNDFYAQLNSNPDWSAEKVKLIIENHLK